MKEHQLLRQTIKALGLVLIASGMSVASAAQINSLDDAGFETQYVGGGFVYLSGLHGSWTYAGGAGLAGNGSAFNVVGASGNQAALLQTNASISQQFYFTQNQFSITFLAESRRYGGGGNPVSVLVDNMVLTFGGNTSFLPGTNQSFSSFTTDAISLSQGIHTLSFKGLSLGQSADVTTFIDDVRINNTVPEPTSLASFIAGMVGFAAFRRKSGAREQA